MVAKPRRSSGRGRGAFMQPLVDNLLSPVVLSFVLGVVACLLRSDLKLPEPIYQGLSIYLLFAIGLKGGAAVAVTDPAILVWPAAATLFFGLTTPCTAFLALRGLGRLGRVDAAAAAAHYGSVSAVTFLAAGEAARSAGLAPEGFLPALVAVLEVPGIVVGLALAGNARSAGASSEAGRRAPREGTGPSGAIREILCGKSIILLGGGLLIGAAAGPERLVAVDPFFKAPFQGALCLFLLELGVAAGRRLPDVAASGWRLPFVGCLLPLLHGCAAVFLGSVSGLGAGGAAVFGSMVASASYIAAPAAVRMALPEASPGVYLTLSLGITFPFNIAVGIPLFLTLAQWIAG